MKYITALAVALYDLAFLREYTGVELVNASDIVPYTIKLFIALALTVLAVEYLMTPNHEDNSSKKK